MMFSKNELIVSEQNFVNTLVNVGPNEFVFGYALSQGNTLRTRHSWNKCSAAGVLS
jgi:hypothetical protein